MFTYNSKSNITVAFHVIEGAAKNNDDDLLCRLVNKGIKGESFTAKCNTLRYWFTKILNDTKHLDNNPKAPISKLISSVNKLLVHKETFKQLMMFTHLCISKASPNHLSRIHKWMGKRFAQIIMVLFLKGHSYDKLVKTGRLLRHFNLNNG